MSILAKKAAQGSKAARTAVYEKNKKSVYFLCLTLLNHPLQARQAAAQIFENFWQTMTESDPAAQDLHTALLQQTTAECRRMLLQTDPDAFLPDRTFSAASEKRPHIHEGDDAAQLYLTYLLARLNPLQRFILSMKLAAGLNTEQIAAWLELPEMIINTAMNRAEDTLNSVLQSLKNVSECPVHSYLELKALMAHLASHIAVPSETEAAVYQHIAATAKPVSRPAAALGYLLCIAAFLLCLYPLASQTCDFFQHTYASINIRNYGNILLELDEEAAPETVANFTKLAESGFYDGLTFHRVIYGFMMQGGDPNGNGTGGSGETITGEFAANGIDNPISHERGVISMARAQDYNSASSQFFIMHADYPELDGLYAAFGHVISGLDVVDNVCASTPVIDSNGTVPAGYQPFIDSIQVLSFD